MAIALRTADPVRLVYTGDESVKSDVEEHAWLDVDDVESYEGATIVEVRPLDALTFRRCLAPEDELERERALVEAGVLTVDGKGFDQHGVDSVCELIRRRPARRPQRARRRRPRGDHGKSWAPADLLVDGRRVSGLELGELLAHVDVRPANAVAQQARCGCYGTCERKTPKGAIYGREWSPLPCSLERFALVGERPLPDHRAGGPAPHRLARGLQRRRV